jgi:hypothetical protein
MATIEAWKKVTKDSIFIQILNESPLLKDSDTPAELSKNALLLWGVVLCGGKSAVKVKAFYDILQDKSQDRISAEDKDFPKNFTLMIELATKLVNHYEAKMSGLDAERSDEIMWKLDQIRDTFAEEEFLDQVFGVNSNLKREEWEANVLKCTKWIFDSNKVRAKIYDKVDKNQA